MPDERRFIVGLGNPGRQYVGTRHNVGFEVLAELRQRWGLGGDTGKAAFSGLTWDTRRRRGDTEVRIVLLAPMTYMNLSGQATQAMLRFFKASPEQMLVVLDDMALPTGRIRVRPDGSAGGQKGLADILRACGTDAVPRLRVGIDSPPGRMDGADYVLGKFTAAQAEEVALAIAAAADAVEDWIFSDDIGRVMEQHNRKA